VIVADTNLLAYLVWKGATTPSAMLARARDKRWIAPALVRYELMNVLVQARKRSESPYDMQFIWLAKERNVQLITADRAVVEAFPQIATLIADFVRR
jgi:predicted nucleic acid-binding protein